MQDFLPFLADYIKSRVLVFGRRFERVKDLIVAFLVVKRGKYSRSFLNTSFLLLISAALIGGPAIAENNPFLFNYIQKEEQSEENILYSDVYAMPIDTTISQKPRDTVITYEVKGGDTLASIALKFDVSIETVKWANDLEKDIIKPGQKLKVPPVTGVVHTVKSGESIYSIAKKYDTEPQKIANFPFNDFVDLEAFSLIAGQDLYVPDGIIKKGPVIAARPQRLNITAGVKGTGNFIWPTSGGISQYPVWYHMAVDISNKGAPPILAADSGTVSYSGCLKWGYGCHIRVVHGNGFETLYGHMSQLSVSAGQDVSQGQSIGTMGSSGRSTGVHLHFEVRKDGALQNPLNYLK